MACILARRGLWGFHRACARSRCSPRSVAAVVCLHLRPAARLSPFASSCALSCPLHLITNFAAQFISPLGLRTCPIRREAAADFHRADAQGRAGGVQGRGHPLEGCVFGPGRLASSCSLLGLLSRDQAVSGPSSFACSFVPLHCSLGLLTLSVPGTPVCCCLIIAHLPAIFGARLDIQYYNNKPICDLIENVRPAPSQK